MRFAGLVGYIETEETSPGIHLPVETTRKMRGDVLSAKTQNSQDGRTTETSLYKDIRLSHRFSLVGDAYSFKNYMYLKWIIVEGHKWEVSSVEIQSPRLLISIGGLYNG